MPVQTPQNQVLAPVHIRILVQKVWGNGEWEELTYWEPDRGGFELLNCERVSLPNIGKATIRFRFGRHITKGGFRVTGVGSTNPDGQWSITGNQTEIRNLSGWVVQIQAARALTRPENGSSDWQVIWLGGCEYHRDNRWPAADVPTGERIYYCVDIWAFYARRWVNTHYSFITKEKGGSATKYDRVRGAPRYNLSRDGREIGNRWNGIETFQRFEQFVKYHTNAGSADATSWNDFLVCQHQIDSNRGSSDPWFEVSGAVTLLSTSGTAWLVREGETVFDVVNQVMDRRRGRGCVFPAWTANGDTFDLDLKVFAQFKDDISYTAPDSGSGEVLPGAVSEGSTVEIDLVGDHRVVAESFSIGERHTTAIDYLETVGEPIEVAFTVSYEDSTLKEGWDTDSWETTFNGGTANERRKQEYLDAYNLHRLPRDWDLIAGDGNGTLDGAINYQCQDDGTVIVSEAKDVAPADIEILPDLPAYIPYDIETDTPSRYDAQDETGAVQRIRFPELAVFRTGEDTYQRVKENANTSTYSFRIVYDGIYLYSRTDIKDGTRTIGDTGASIGSSEDYTDLCFTLNARIPHRVRVASGDDSSYRRKRLYVPGLHLWLWHHKAIWSVNPATSAPLRGAYGGTDANTPGIARDDRDRLMFIHQLAWSWYQDSRQNFRYTIRDCAMVSGFEGYETRESDPVDTTRQSPSTISYPTPGQFVTTLIANGEENEVNCPITRISYDHTTMSTTIAGDWVDLDFRSL